MWGRGEACSTKEEIEGSGGIEVLSGAKLSFFSVEWNILLYYVSSSDDATQTRSAYDLERRAGRTTSKTRDDEQRHESRCI